MKILVTGFEPFGGETVNPSWEAVKLAGYSGAAELIKRELPVTWAGGKAALSALIDEYRPDAVLMTGQAGGRKGVTIERIAANCMEASVPDNDGVSMCGEKIFPDSPDGLFSTLPYREMKSALDDAGIDVSYSMSAGTYICNLVMYTALAEARAAEKPFIAGFVHFPYITEQAHDDKPSMPLSELARAVEIMISVISGEA